MIIKAKIKLSVYETGVELLVVDTMDEFQQLLEKRGIIIPDISNCDGITLGYEDLYHIVFIKERISHNLLAHEIFHLALMVTKDIDINDEESQAWLNGYITEQVYKILTKKNITIKL
jgi:hypothetical protein